MNGKESVGQPINRVDGILKVTGAAPYATDYAIKNIAYAVLFKSTVAAGKISSIDTTIAEKEPGVLSVITHLNAPKLNVKGGIRGGALLQSEEIKFYGQHIGMVVAETFEQARHAAQLIKVEYTKGDLKTDFEKMQGEGVTPKDNPDAIHGDVAAAMQEADHKIDVVYSTPIEHHHPMEPHATIAVWQDGKLILYNGSQVVNGAQSAAANTLNLKPMCGS